MTQKRIEPLSPPRSRTFHVQVVPSRIIFSKTSVLTDRMEEEKGEEGGEEERENGRRRRRRKIVVERVEKTRMTKDKVDQWSNQRSREFFRTSLLCLYTLFIPI